MLIKFDENTYGTHFYKNEKFLLFWTKTELDGGGIVHDAIVAKPYTEFVSHEVEIVGDSMDDIFPCYGETKLDEMLLDKQNGIYLVDINVSLCSDVDGTDITIKKVNYIKPVLIFDEVNLDEVK